MTASWEKSVRERWQKLAGQRDPRVWISIISESDLDRQVATIQKRAAAGESMPLLGLTFAIKDNIDLAGVPTTAGCPDFASKPREDAFAVALLKNAGAVALGKTTMDQFATGLVGTRSPHGACPNVFNSDYISGGSSSGSAVAVAREEVDFSLGTDTAGSGRVPAAYNGLIGYKPTRGLVSASGVLPACRTLDCVSVFARTVELTRRVAEVVRVYDASDPFARKFAPGAFSAPQRGNQFRFGVPKKIETFGDGEANSLYEKAIRNAEESAGTKVVVDDAPLLEAGALLYQGPWVAERYAAVGEWIEKHPASVDPTVRSIILDGREQKAFAAFQAMYRLAELRRRIEAIWNECDCLLLPTVTTSPRIAEVNANPIELNSRLGLYNNFVNLLDLAAVTVPAGYWASGVGFGVNLIAPAFTDNALLELAALIRNEQIPATTKAAKIPLAVLGAHLRGQPLNHQLTTIGARFLKQTRTAPEYRLYSLPNTTPTKPGLARSSHGGANIEVELYELSPESFGTFVAAVPPPLCIGNAKLEDGSSVKCFLCEPTALEGAQEITSFGGWRSYLNSNNKPLA